MNFEENIFLKKKNTTWGLSGRELAMREHSRNCMWGTCAQDHDQRPWKKDAQTHRLGGYLINRKQAYFLMEVLLNGRHRPEELQTFSILIGEATLNIDVV